MRSQRQDGRRAFRRESAWVAPAPRRSPGGVASLAGVLWFWAAGATALALSPPLFLADGWWRGAVTLEHGPVEFFLEVARVGPLAPQVRVHTEARIAEVAHVAGGERAITLASGQAGERLEGELRGETYFGRYFPGDGGPSGGFAFRAQPAQPWEPVPPLKVWNLTGIWELQTGPLDRIEVVLAHRDHSLRAIWREPDGTVRYLSGRLEGQRFALEIWRESRVVSGQYSPDGVLRGEWSDAQGNTTRFQMTRKMTGQRSGR